MGLFWKEKTPSYNRRNTVIVKYLNHLSAKIIVKFANSIDPDEVAHDGL